ncbi:MAG TPA: PEGA domain-containing protein, partial [Blastocatellia bacterium]|nr:PEGA domain-containing protein [Blastocatellia bacterium]
MDLGSRHPLTTETEAAESVDVEIDNSAEFSDSSDQSRVTGELSQPDSAGWSDAEVSGGQIARLDGRSSRRLWITAAGFAIVLTILTVAGVYLITKKSATLDQLVILTVPSGADIKLDSKEYGHSPVKLEKVPIGKYTLTITKDGFEPIVQEIDVVESQPSQPLEYRLKPLASSDASRLPPEERIKQFEAFATESFTRGHYAIPYDLSALWYADSILALDPNHEFGNRMRERIQNSLHQTAKTEAARGDLGRAQEIYQVLVEFYPDDEEARAAASRLDAQLSSKRGEVRDLIAKAQDALRAGRLIDPERASAYYFSKQALARDRQNSQARDIRESVKAALTSNSEHAYRKGESEIAIRQLERMTQLFPEDTNLRARLREWTTQRAEQTARANDPDVRRQMGLEMLIKDDFSGAIPHLEFAMTNGRGTAEVVVGLARALHALGRLDEADKYYTRVPPSTGDQYRSSIAARGEIAEQRGDSASALARYKEAMALGGSTRYSIKLLQHKIDTIERKQRDKAAEPLPLTIGVTHQHGTFRGTCKGTLSV